MNKLVYSALAITLCSVPGIASDNWSSLDQELNSLSASLQAQNQGGPKLGGWLRSAFRSSSDLQTGGSDIQGFELNDARIEITGDAGNTYSYKISFGVETGTAVLKDAYAKWEIANGVNGKMGRYKVAFFQSSLIPESRLLFIHRSALGDIFSSRDEGFEISGEFEQIQYQVGVQNGTDGQGDEYRFTARVRADLMGNGTGKTEGAYGSGDETNLSAAVAWQDEGSLDDGMVLGAEVQMTSGPFSVAGEAADFDEGTAGAFGITNGILDQWGIVGGDVADTTPWGVTGSYMFTDMYEAAVRYEDADDTEDTTSIRVAVNRYVAGHDIKWTVEWQTVDTDNAIDDFDVLGLGLALSF